MPSVWGQAPGQLSRTWLAPAMAKAREGTDLKAISVQVAVMTMPSRH